MLEEKTARKTFFIYRCVSQREDGSKIERIFKVQSYFNLEDLAISLVLMSDSPGRIIEIRVHAEDYESIFSETDKLYDGVTFADLEDEKNIAVEIIYEDGMNCRYLCEYIGTDTQSKRITRTTPICVSAHGYSRYDIKGFLNEVGREYKNSYVLSLSDAEKRIHYEDTEKMHLEWAMHDVKRLFNFYKELYYQSFYFD